jgi:hypothetical protein
MRTPPFTLSDDFLAPYQTITPPFGFNGLGELVYLRTYSRVKADGTQERWWETVRRVVEGTYTMQKRWITEHHLGWSERKAQRSAQEMYDRMFYMKFLPPGRGLWAMGSPLTEGRETFAALNNCSFVSTKDLASDLADPFTFLMDASMLGIGVGFDTAGAGMLALHAPNPLLAETYVVPDTREGWVEALKLKLLSYFCPDQGVVEYDFSLVRPEGEPIKGFGGVAAGPGPLKDLLGAVDGVLERERATGDGTLSVTGITDICNLTAKCVVAGNVRRSALISFGEADDEEFLDLKNYEVNPHRAAYGWTSNNSVFAKLGMDYGPSTERVVRNGEPGYMWLENAQAYSRMVDEADFKDARVMGTNPCGEQGLESYELCCVSADTRIHTRAGALPIGDLVGQAVEVWNGAEWSEVTPYLAGYNKQMYRVTLSDGSFLDVTDNHRWLARPDTARKFRDMTTLQLTPGDVLPEFSLGDVVGEAQPMAYEYGFFAGDGYMDKGVPMLALFGEAKQSITSSISGRVYAEEFPKGYNVSRQRVNLVDVCDAALATQLRRSDGLPAEVFTWDRESTAQFIAGYIDADGSISNSGTGGEGLKLHGPEGKMRDVQTLLRRIGVDHASVYVLKGQKSTLTINGRETHRNYDQWVCQVPSFEADAVPTRVKVRSSTASRFAKNNAHPEGALIDRARKQRVVSIVPLGMQDSYCFTEPKRGMGVFGNVLTYQCLVETFPTNHDSLEDYQRTLKFAYLYGKTVTLGRTHWERTNRVMLRNRRIGLSQSGIQQAVAKLGIEEYREWCEAGYATVQYYDKVYSEWLAIPRSIKVTTVKPSGSVSLLAGATPGMHWPEALTYVRRMRLGRNSDLLPALQAAGYPIEPAVGSEDSTLVVEIPVRIGDAVRPAHQVSMWEQLAMAAFLQRYWSDNQVSATVTFDPATEGPQLAHALDYYQYQLKGISCLPRTPAGAYAQMPYEAITVEEYEARAAALTPVQFGSTHDEAVPERFCSNDTCTV